MMRLTPGVFLCFSAAGLALLLLVVPMRLALSLYLVCLYVLLCGLYLLLSSVPVVRTTPRSLTAVLWCIGGGLLVALSLGAALFVRAAVDVRA